MSEQAEGDARCCVCGCTDSNACDLGCEWIVVDREQGLGVCSSCASSEEEAQELLEQELAA